MNQLHLEDPNWDNEELPYGWAGECIINKSNRIGIISFFNRYNTIVTWIKDNIRNPQSNTRWKMIGDAIYIQFRRPKDMVFFKLVWS